MSYALRMRRYGRLRKLDEQRLVALQRRVAESLEVVNRLVEEQAQWNIAIEMAHQSNQACNPAMKINARHWLERANAKLRAVGDDLAQARDEFRTLQNELIAQHRKTKVWERLLEKLATKHRNELDRRSLKQGDELFLTTSFRSDGVET